MQKLEDIKLYPGGASVGIKLSTEGVLVVGFSNVETDDGSELSPAKVAGMQLGDVLLEVNNKKIESSKQLISLIKSANSSTINVEFMRNGCKFNKDINLIKEGENYKLGLWVRDSTAGIGTLTFYHEDTNTFGALGHPITDGDTNTTFTIKDGDLLSASILSVRKGEKGVPGELRGLFVNEKKSIGQIESNSSSGIFGKTYQPLVNSIFNQPMSVGFRNEVVEGPAKIITTIDDNGPKEYDIEIIKLLQQDKSGPKSMIIRVTDEELLSKTGGIVQGMSGSPIIQNDKIVGYTGFQEEAESLILSDSSEIRMLIPFMIKNGIINQDNVYKGGTRIRKLRLNDEFFTVEGKCFLKFLKIESKIGEVDTSISQIIKRIYLKFGIIQFEFL